MLKSLHIIKLIWLFCYLIPKKGDSPQRTQRKALINIREIQGIMWVLKNFKSLSVFSVVLKSLNLGDI
jgi:ribosomal protein L28